MRPEGAGWKENVPGEETKSQSEHWAFSCPKAMTSGEKTREGNWEGGTEDSGGRLKWVGMQEVGRFRRKL